MCGAIKCAYGLEPTPEMYVEHTVEIFEAIKRVLKKDGIVWLNIGDSCYGGGFGHSGDTAEEFARRYPKQGSVKGTFLDSQDRKMVGNIKRTKHPTLKPKDLCLIPFRVAIALQEARWYVRRDVIWDKPNAMCENVNDRPTTAHEYIFMITKSKKYYYNADAVREGYTRPVNRWGGEKLTAKGTSMWDKKTGQTTYRDRDLRPNKEGRNLRSVWKFPTTNFPFKVKERPYAVFPEELPRRCILASTKPGDVVLDPFVGSGTTLVVAAKLGREAWGIDMSENYLQTINIRVGSFLRQKQTILDSGYEPKEG